MRQSDLDLYMQEGMSDYFESLEQMMFKHSSFHVDVLDQGGYYELYAEFPGIPKENIHIEVEGGRLTLRAALEEDGNEQKNYLRRERHVKTYARQFDISKVDADGIKAKYSNGLLRMTLPKKEGYLKQEKTIPIE